MIRRRDIRTHREGQIHPATVSPWGEVRFGASECVS
ncbi:hypothetical protein SAMN05444320_102690 [Streptoalloteichus hindustanus]|uniref:Uncharacterized protein n=1 Tax=Streptoalloteichus hindustanus TaxID=2017 RepID=A0A1M4ZCW7_STRHI|nr:hypothetical protein SAMN05444320_102690 [Streptoalloteichus hindustanus]